MVGANDTHSKKIIISSKKKRRVLVRPARKPGVRTVAGGYVLTGVGGN